MNRDGSSDNPMDRKQALMKVTVLLYCYHLAKMSVDLIGSDAVVCNECHTVQKFVVPITDASVPDN